MKLNEKKRATIKDNEHKYVMISGVQYFCKKAENNYNELIANRLSKTVGINCAEYYLVKVDKDLYRRNYQLIGELLIDRGLIDKEKGR